MYILICLLSLGFSDDPLLSPGRPIVADCACDTAFSAIKNWLKECLSDHSLCRYQSSVSCLPKRVVDVGPSDGSREPRLLITNGGRGTWLTLTHSWGGVKDLITTTENIHNLRRRIPWSELPSLFRDSITITRRLGVQYLWIDTLCIVQDDRTDWREQSARMSDIYRHSMLNISATTASNCREQILTKRDVRFTSIALVLQSNDFNLNGKVIRIRPLLMNRSEAIDGRGSYLSKRGWTMQERLMSPRTLHFGKEQLFWECRQSNL